MYQQAVLITITIATENK